MTQLPGIQPSLRNTKGTPEDTDFAKTRKLDGSGGGKRNLFVHGELPMITSSSFIMVGEVTTISG